ncbi:Nn.00g061560.m01.CDS01 [Neocucurbitaria sp. VM-36]
MALVPLGVQVRPYRDYLTPALHRRFNKAGRYTLLLCYVIALWMGEWDNLLWLWFPIGPTGIRTLLLFLPALIIYVLRVAQWHVGRRQTQTQFETFKKYFLRKSTLLTLAFYAFSAWIYSEVYIWSRTSKDKLGLTEYGRAHERLKLNERPLYLRYLFFLLAVAQSGIHLWRDYDKIEVPAMKPKKEREDASAATPIRLAPKPRQVLATHLLAMAKRASILSFIVTAGGFVLYFVGPRYVIWDYYYSFSKYFVSLSKTSKPTGLAPFLPLCAMFAVEGALLVLLWEFVNKAFDLYIAQEPLKNAQPITADSKDPNGTLLNGLKSKKEAVKAIAFWELALITDAFPDRRKTIYGEIERKTAPTYQQVTDICLGEIKFLIQRLSIGLNPAYNPDTAPGKQQPAAPVSLVPQISQPLKDDKQIAALPLKPDTKWDHFESAAAGIAKSYSAPGNSQQAYGREAINKSVKKAQEGAEQAASFATLYYNQLVKSPLGAPFSQSLPRTASLVVLGAPFSRISLICNAVTALANLTVFSLSQDSLGRFHEGVPAIIHVFTTAISQLDEYMSTVQIHWSDKSTLSKPEAERRKVPEVEEVRECLREGLEKILGSFNEYLGGMGLSKLEILEAKKVAAVKKGPEMLQAGPGR